MEQVIVQANTTVESVEVNAAQQAETVQLQVNVAPELVTIQVQEAAAEQVHIEVTEAPEPVFVEVREGYDGKTAYQLAVLNGYTGAEPEWLASLKGEKGDKGDTGEKGDKGDQGDQGNTGATGADVDPDTTQKLELLNRFKTGYGRYNEFVETGGNVTQINYWSAADKVLKLFTEDITYVSGAPTQIVVTDEITGAILTTVFTYTGSKITNVTDTFS